MNALLERAIAAHGGMQRWNEITGVKIHASITGAVWHLKGRPDVLKDVTVEAETRVERLIMRFPERNKRSTFQPKHIVIEEEAAAPRVFEAPISTFAGHVRETPWEDVHVAYFSGEALWTYLTIPFVYTYPGFVTEELLPWEEDGEQWRRLKATFPSNVATHTREQVSYFGPDGLLRRHDYTVDILGGATGANYASDYRTVDGIVVPTRRRVYAYDENHHKVSEPLLVAIDMKEISFT